MASKKQRMIYVDGGRIGRLVWVVLNQGELIHKYRQLGAGIQLALGRRGLLRSPFLVRSDAGPARSAGRRLVGYILPGMPVSSPLAVRNRYRGGEWGQGRGVKNAVLKSGAAAPGGRVHFTTDEPSRIEFYYGPNSQRVRDVVAKYDPHRLFASCNGMSF